MSRSALLAYDPALPARDVLLDTAQVGDRLRAVLCLPPDDRGRQVQRVRAKYRLGQSLRVLHRVPTGDAIALVSTRMTTPDRAERLADRAGVTAGRSGGPVSPGFDRALGAVSWLFPHDRKIPTLERLLRPGPAVRRLLPGIWAGSELAAYVPEKAATARLHDAADGSLGYGKVYADDDALDSALARAAAVTPLTDAGTRVPRLLGVSAEDRLLVLEVMPGTRLDALHAAELGTGLAALGRALAALHRLPTGDLPAVTRLLPDRLQAAARIVAAARPETATAAHGLSERLSAMAPAPGTALVHGDLHLKNAMLAGDRLSLLDLDQAGAGQPAADLGSLLAALAHSRVAGRLAAEDEQRLGELLLTAYRNAGGRVEQDELRWHVAAALLAERALRAVNRVLPDTLDRLDELLAEAASLVGEPMQHPVGAR